MNISRFKISTVLIITLILISCKREPAGSGLNEGVIEYKIIYLQDKVGNYSPAVLPQKMKVEFKNDVMKTSVEGALGFFRLINIADLDHYKNTTYLKFIDKKYIYKGKKKETACCFGVLEEMDVEFTGKEKDIAGFICKEAIASFPETGQESFSIYYTEDIDIKDPNVTSPYFQIPGIMMEFNTSMGAAKMRVIAEKFHPSTIPEKEFAIPEDYRPVSKTELENILHALME